MASMKVSLPGLFSNIIADIPKRNRWRAFHAAALEEVLGHLKGVAAGKYTFEQFAEHYCIKVEGAEPAAAPEAPRAGCASGQPKAQP